MERIRPSGGSHNLVKLIIFALLICSSQCEALAKVPLAVSQQPTSNQYGQFAPMAKRKQVYGSWGGTWGYQSSDVPIATAQQQPVYISMPASSSRLASGTWGVTGDTGPITATAAISTPLASQTSQVAGAAQVQGASVNSNTMSTASGANAASTLANSISGAGNSAAATTAPLTIIVASTGQARAADGTADGTTAAAASTTPGGTLAAANSSLPAGFTIPSNTLNINAGVVTTQATAFTDGYCVPRQSYIIVNTTAISCNPGSNLTKWDGQPICARIACEKQLDNGNILVAAAYCRTVVEPPQFYCPTGCELITQTLFNTTTNATQAITRCACRAGNQPCPGNYVGCVCQPAYITNLNASTSYLLCSAQQTMCPSYCGATVNTLGPLCPIQPDATLPGQISTGEDALTGPVYPRWSWDLASQGQATAAVAPGTPIGRRLLMWRRSSRNSNMLLALGASGSGSSSSGKRRSAGRFHTILPAWYKRQLRVLYT